MKKSKVLLGIIIGILLSGVIVYAESVISGSQVSYEDNVGLGANNVQTAIEKINEKATTKINEAKRECPRGQMCKSAIDVAYTYNETAGSTQCINGEEETCQVTECYKNKNSNSCPMGTIIKYWVNNEETKYFYVLHDDGEVMTLQQRENTVKNVAWYSSEDKNQYGPVTALSALEQATSTWINVNPLEYEPGVTILYQNAYTGCGFSESTNKLSCHFNGYNSDVLGVRKSRARMITGTEANSTSCLTHNASAPQQNKGSCPDFMHNYLYYSTNSGGSYNDNSTTGGEHMTGYWTMSAHGDSSHVWYIQNSGYLYLWHTTTQSDVGARAVIEISK